MAKIVVLDDQPDICEFIRVRLSEDGHDVRVSHVGDEAIDFCHLFRPDVLITDWRLESEYDGLEVAQAFRFANENIKTILITGYSVEDVKKQCGAREIFKTIPKPFSLDEIATAVHQALSKSSIEFSTS
jgi:two-component system response regulator HydG